MTVLGLCHVCSNPTNAHCSLCGKTTCNAHLSQVGSMWVCPNCRMKFQRSPKRDLKFMG